MLMAESEVFAALGSDNQTISEAYPQVYANWQQSIAVDLTTNDDDLLAGKRLPFRKWFTWTARAGMVVLFVGSCISTAVLASMHINGRIWKWPAWVAGSLAAWGLDWAAFYLLALTIEKAFATSQHVIYYMHGSRRPLERFIAACSSLVIFAGLFAPFHMPGSLPVLKALACIAISALGLLAAQVTTKVLAAHFHRQGFFERLQKALRDEYYLMALSKPRGARLGRKSWTEQTYIQNFKPKTAKTTRKLADTRLNREDPRLLHRLDAVERHVRSNRLKLVFDRCNDVRDVASAKRMAFYIFWNVIADKSREWLLRSDLEHFLPDDEVDGAFSLLDPDGDGRPTWEECRAAVIQVFDRRRHLSASLKDTDSIMGTLHSIVIGLVQVVEFFIFLLVWRVDVVHVWLTFSSIALAFTFVFGTSIKTAYENVVFIFFIHPYDVGDRLIYDDRVYTVHKIKLSTTILEEDSGVRVWFPNIRLSQLPIYNQTRAEVVRESFAYLMDFNTPASIFDDVQDRTSAYIKCNSKDFQGECRCVTTAAIDPLKLRLTLSVTYSFNATQSGRLSTVRHGLILTITSALSQAGAQYSEPQQTSAGGKPNTVTKQHNVHDDDTSETP